jgi:long-subunit fatty acid transport protein
MQYLGNAQLGAMGQVSQGIRNHTFINNQNPASYSTFDLTLFEAGISYTNGSVSNATSSSGVENYSFNYFALGVPVSAKKGIGVSFGMQPYSAMGYDVKLNANYPGFQAQEVLKGTGGLTRLYGGYGMRLFKDSAGLRSLSAGFNGGFVFGQIIQQQQLLVNPVYNIFSLDIDRRTYMNTFLWQAGVQYEQKTADEKYVWVAGASYTLAQSVQATQDYAYRTVRFDGISTIDTIDIIKDKTGTIQLPAQWQAGIAFSKKDNWTLAADVSGQSWSEFRFYDRNDSLRNSIAAHIGFSYIPDFIDFKNILNRTEYRFGIRYNTGNVNIAQTNIATLGFSAGAGIPLGKSKSRLNITAEYFMRGTTQNNLLREEYFRITLGVNMVDKWFNRYKYD